MNRFLDLSTRAKLFLAFGALVVLLGIVAATGYHGTSEVRRSQRLLYESSFADVADIKDARSAQLQTRIALLNAALGTRAGDVGPLQQQVDTLRRAADEALRRVAARAQGDALRLERLESFQAVRRAVQDTRENQTYPLLAAGKLDEVRRLLAGVQAERDQRLETLADALVKDTEAAARTALERSDAAAWEAVRLSSVIGLAALALAVGLALLLNEALAAPLKEVCAAAQAVAGGDLTVTLPDRPRRDEVGTLVHTFRNMTASLRELSRDLAQGVSVLGTSAAEITAATAQVASGSAQTAAAVSETTATVEEVKQTAVLSAEKARSVAESAQKTVQVSQDGRRSVEESIAAMNGIDAHMRSIAERIVRLAEQNQAIGEIIATVTDLAEQSNLLAVNAAIEAAKAGEHGRGFSVVAQEVRSLAQQSRQATAQVRTILGDIQKATTGAVGATEQGSRAVEAGLRLSAQAGESIRVLSESIGESAHAAMQIAASAQQQLAGMDQVAQAMQSINEASSQNAASTRQAESAAHSLQELGLRLTRLVERYRV